ncbi:MAG: hypothetical protein HY000_26875 [Planctomycetes bacterium]|nr:hypothetical protein [Planctomycetota bacterium]
MMFSKWGSAVWSSAVLALGFSAAPSQAQSRCCCCQPRQQNLSQGQSGLPQQQLQQLLQQQRNGLQFQQLLQQQQHQQFQQMLQQQKTGLVGLQQPQQTSFLSTLQQQGQWNSYLIAQEKKQNSLQRSRKWTRAQQQQFQDAVQAALLQTKELLTTLQQKNGMRNQSTWLVSLHEQRAALADLSRQYSESSAIKK